MLRRLLTVLLLLGCAAAAWLWFTGEPVSPEMRSPPPARARTATPRAAAGGGQAADEACGLARPSTAALANAGSVQAAQWSVFGRPELGWEVYAPLAAREIGAPCAPQTEGFAEALQRWEGAHGLPATGVMTADVLRALDLVWLRRRPFVAATRAGACPAPPLDGALAAAAPQEGYRGKAVRLHAEALAAYRRLVAAARADSAPFVAEPQILTLVSGYRGPDEEAARCATGGCGTPGRARCSAHRTGMAMDLFLGDTPGGATSTDHADRLRLSRTPAYLWLVANADRFGFVPYPFEPWHWEYVGGEAPRAAA